MIIVDRSIPWYSNSAAEVINYGKDNKNYLKKANMKISLLSKIVRGRASPLKKN